MPYIQMLLLLVGFRSVFLQTSTFIQTFTEVWWLCLFIRSSSPLSALAGPARSTSWRWVAHPSWAGSQNPRLAGQYTEIATMTRWRWRRQTAWAWSIVPPSGYIKKWINKTTDWTVTMKRGEGLFPCLSHHCLSCRLTFEPIPFPVWGSVACRWLNLSVS